MLPMPFSNPKTYPGHLGVDFPQRKGTPIPASGDGIVTAISFSKTGGWRIWVKYNNGTTLKYVHMDKRSDIPHNVDEQIRYGEAVAYVGMYGKAVGPIPASTGYHLHLENGDKAGEAAVWEVVDRNNWVGKPAPVPTPQMIKENPMQFALVLYDPKGWNRLLIVDLFNKKIYNLGNDPKSGLRAHYAKMPYAVMEDKEWTERFKDFVYVN